MNDPFHNYESASQQPPATLSCLVDIMDICTILSDAGGVSPSTQLRACLKTEPHGVALQHSWGTLLGDP